MLIPDVAMIVVIIVVMFLKQTQRKKREENYTIFENLDLLQEEKY